MTYITNENLKRIATAVAANIMENPKDANGQYAEAHTQEVRGWLKRNKPYTVSLILVANKYGGVEATLSVLPFYSLYSYRGNSTVSTIFIPNMDDHKTFGALPIIKHLYAILKGELDFPKVPKELQSETRREDLIQWTAENAKVGKEVVEAFFDKRNAA